MSKSDLPLEKIDVSRVYKNLPRPKWSKDKPVNGWDTETSAGRLVLLSWYFERTNVNGCLWSSGMTVEPDAVFEMLTHRDARAAVNVWYNLDFDANVILSALPTETVYELQLTGNAMWNKCAINYIPKKALVIRRGKHKYCHYDVAQFYLTSLDKAAKEWLGEGKLEGLDRARFDSLKYLLAHEDELQAYALRDARLVARLWRQFVTEAEALRIPCGAPYSTGYLGEQYMNATFDEKPDFGFTKMQALAWRAYQGGRFELIQRGLIPRVQTYDIVSAYPYVLSGLPAPETLEWRRYRKGATVEQIREADYGFVNLIVSTDPARPIQPFGVKRKMRVEYPALELTELAVLRETFLAALDAGLLRDFRIVDTWLAHKVRTTVYPFGFLRDLFAARKEMKAQGRDLTQYILKKVINSIYGKTCQITERKKLTDENVKPEHLLIDAMPKVMQEWLAEMGFSITREFVAGAYFNPFLASYITGLTRLELWQSVVRSGLENRVVMLATDSVMLSGGSGTRAEFQATIGDELGNWTDEGAGRAFVVGSGIYEVYTDDGKVKRRTRGFNDGVPWEVTIEKPLLEIALETEGAKCRCGKLTPKQPYCPAHELDISRKRPLKIGQALYQHYDLAQVGAFLDFPRALRAGMDTKRAWPRGEDVTWHELTTGPEMSAPKSYP